MEARHMTLAHYIGPDGVEHVHELGDVEQGPLDSTGALATLLAVLQVVPVADAANAVGLTVSALEHEAEAWGL